MSYGLFPDLFRRAAGYVDKILRGAKSNDLPVVQPTKFDFTVNLATAESSRADDLGVPPPARRPGDRMKAADVRFWPMAEGDNLSVLKAAGLWQEGEPLRLHLGCGEQHFPGFVNIDYPPEHHRVMQVRADAYANILQMCFPKASVDEIRLHHVFEHFNRV